MKAVFLLNMGGPTALSEVRPFLFRLFKDPHILNVPAFIRYPLALLLSVWRTTEARKIYTALGGQSPLLEQSERLSQKIKTELGADYDVYIGMSYARPLIQDVVQDIKQKDYDEIILVPLYPHYSSTTSASVLEEARKGLGSKKIREINSFPTMKGYIKALSEGLLEYLVKAHGKGEVSILFSAHGLPEKIVERGDPYPEQCRQTVEAIAHYLDLKPKSYKLCYQSRLGPVKWITPFLDMEIKKAASNKKAIVVVPISFICENSETLYELDLHYRKKALEKGAVFWGRVRVPSQYDVFINDLVHNIKVNAP